MNNHEREGLDLERGILSIASKTNSSIHVEDLLYIHGSGFGFLCLELGGVLADLLKKISMVQFLLFGFSSFFYSYICYHGCPECINGFQCNNNYNVVAVNEPSKIVMLDC